MGRYGRGHVPDPAGHRKVGFRHLVGHRSGMTPPGLSADLSAWAPAVMDQGASSSCVGHAVSTAISTRCAGVGSPLSFLPSPTAIYTLARCIDRTPIGGRLPALEDVGSEPNQAWRGVSEWGLRPMQPLPGRYSDADPATINAEPLLGDLELEGEVRHAGYYAIESVGEEKIHDLRFAIANGYPVTFATFADRAFEEWDPASGPLGLPDASDRYGGGHYLCAIGYATDPNGRTSVKFRNSWGAKWGRDGDGWGSEAFIDQITDLWVADVRVIP